MKYLPYALIAILIGYVAFLQECSSPEIHTEYVHLPCPDTAVVSYPEVPDSEESIADKTAPDQASKPSQSDQNPKAEKPKIEERSTTSTLIYPDSTKKGEKNFTLSPLKNLRTYTGSFLLNGHLVNYQHLANGSLLESKYFSQTFAQPPVIQPKTRVPKRNFSIWLYGGVQVSSRPSPLVSVIYIPHKGKLSANISYDLINSYTFISLGRKLY